MDLLTLALALIVIAAVYYYFKKKLSYFEERQVPYVPGWPLLGNMASSVFRIKHFSTMMCDFYNSHPDAKYIGIFDFGNRPMIFLRDPELIKSVTIKNFDHFQNHNVVFDEQLDPLFGGNLLSMLNERWREARNLLSPAFTSSKMKGMFEFMVECTNNFINYLSELPDNKRRAMDTKDLFTKYTNDVIATCAFGINIDSLKNPNNEFYVLGRRVTNFDGIAMLKFFLARLSPQLCKLLNIKFIDDAAAKFFKNIISDMVKTRDEKGINRPDMIQLMMNARNTDKKYLKLDLNEMTAQAFIFFFGGFETTSSHMCVMAHELAINPDIQKKLQDEIDSVMAKSKGNPSYEDILEMQYLDAVFNEALRRHSQASVLDRVCQKPFELPPAYLGGKPFVIQPGTNIWFSASAIHMDPKYYEDPYKFDPERYFQKKVTINDVLNLGFGIGPRSCIGNRFAILETKVLFVYLLSKFNLVANEKTCSPLKYNTSTFAIKPDGGFSLSIELRNRKI
ncbi:cytochrome P450 9e2-like [Phymastichus coffea]|uniref:cytochrome P450 9e2-like n=1 Tax=Phymastichus coffea TaxID=108790 RepID=UPI00273C7E47|nr:cytochrome P450 9e2-like [Phymastichus coffea]